jgi:hypothetical protein
MDKHTAPLPLAPSQEDTNRRTRWDRAAFRLHALSMNPELAVLGSLSAVEAPGGELPVHWMLLDPALASIVRSAAANQKELARWRGLSHGSDAQLAAEILVRLGLSGVTEPASGPAWALFTMRLIWRSACMTIAQHRDMERAAQARRPRRSLAP